MAATFHIVNLGCKVNKVESDGFAVQLLQAGLQQSALEEAQLVVINTCAVTSEAEKKTRKAVRHACAANPCASVVVTGCSAALHPSVYEEMSARVHVASKAEAGAYVLAVATELQAGQTAASSMEFPDAASASELPNTPSEVPVAPTGEGFRSRVGVKIQDGCNNACTYCIVHVARGKSSSMPAAGVLETVATLVRQNVHEIVLTGINLGTYESSHQGRACDLTGLLELLLAQTQEGAPDGGMVRFRISSIEPLNVTDALMQLMAAAGGRICRHLHMPLQAGSTKVLREMNRPYTAEQYKQLVDELRTRIPGISLSTDIIVGFPGETEQEFRETCTLAEYCQFSRIHVFPYSLREGTPAAERTDQIPAGEKTRRAAELRALSRAFAARDRARRSHTVEYALVEGKETWMTESYHCVRPAALSHEAPVGSLVLYEFPEPDPA